MKYAAIIVASGTGSRYQSDIPKQFTYINNKMVLEYTLEKFIKLIDKIIIVVPQDYKQSISDHFAQFPTIEVCAGGNSRQHSVLKGLQHLQEYTPNIVTIHDGVRLLVSKKMILDSLETASKYESAVPIVPIIDSLWQKNKDQTLSTSCNRELFACSQTPQAFNYHKILQAHLHGKESLSQFSDCASVYTNLFNNINTYEGNKTNIKLTTSEDLKFIKFLLQA